MAPCRTPPRELVCGATPRQPPPGSIRASDCRMPRAIDQP
jgi:hypothetical protein